jgi:hypothetical protein
MDYHFVTNSEYKKIVQRVLDVDTQNPEDGTSWISPDELLLPEKFYLLFDSQQLLLMRYFLTKGLTLPNDLPEREQLINWFLLTVGKEILPDIQSEELERFCLLQIVPEFQGDFSLMDYVNCTNLALNDALRNNYRLPQSMYQHPNLIPYYKYWISKENIWDTETLNHMHHVLSLVEKSSFLGREILSITYNNTKTSVHPDERGFMLYQSKVN